MSIKKVKYIHKETVYNMIAPDAIVKELIRLLDPQSVLDTGCGLSTSLHCFLRL